MSNCEFSATQVIRPAFEFKSKGSGHGDEDDEAGAKRNVVEKCSHIIQEGIYGLIHRCSILISEGGTANDTEGEQKREEYEDHVVNVETTK